MNSFARRGMLIAVALVAGNTLAAELETEEAKLGYIIGMDIGNSLRNEGTAVDIDALLEAIRTTYEGGTPAMTAEEAQAVREDFIAKRRAVAETEASEISDRNLAEGEAFLADNATREGVVTTESGLQYKVLTMGDGARPAAADTVEVHYRGTLLDGTEFDSSYSRNQEATFKLNQVIPGWTEGLQLMPVGSTFKFFIPANLAYGPNGPPSIGPNATLIFDVELIDVQ